MTSPVSANAEPIRSGMSWWLAVGGHWATRSCALPIPLLQHVLVPEWRTADEDRLWDNSISDLVSIGYWLGHERRFLSWMSSQVSFAVPRLLLCKAPLMAFGG
jgi:hypothetical protein